MPEIRVAVDGKKFKVLINNLQRGVSYSTEAHANHEADKIRKEWEVRCAGKK